MARERYIRSADGTELYTRAAGKGLTVVLADGIGCDGFVWRHIEADLVRRYRVIRWHHRGHGKSQPPDDLDRLSMEFLVQDLHAVLDAYQVDHAVLMGHSMGVQLILDYAVQYPGRVDGLVPICGSYGRLLDTFHDSGLASSIFPKLRDLVFGHHDWAQWLWSSFVPTEAVYLYTTLAEVKGALVRRNDFKPYFDHLATMDVQIFFRMLDKVRLHSVEDKLQKIAAPTLVIAGDRDTFTPVWLSRRMARLLPNAELLIVPHGSHATPLEMPEFIELRLQRFFVERILPIARARAALKRRERPAPPLKRRAPKG
jgi:pimeloyl-ACP methyl ester carboxylesterase